VPLKALRAWLEARRPVPKRLGLDTARFAGHSLRAGFVTSADAKGHVHDFEDGRDPAQVGRYAARLCPDAELFNAHAGKGLL
jgi:hypothetical protein